MTGSVLVTAGSGTNNPVNSRDGYNVRAGRVPVATVSRTNPPVNSHGGYIPQE